MKRIAPLLLLSLAGCGLLPPVRADDDFLDALEEKLSFSANHDDIRAHLSGTLDLEGYAFDQPAPALIDAPGTTLFNPRLTLYLDAQLGPTLYAFASFRADRGFDPTNASLRGRLDEYALRFTPWVDGRFNIQAGKFATVVGNWTPRHDSWDNAFITAPLPYENLTGIWYVEAARSAAVLALWANVGTRPSTFFPIKTRSVPIIWGPSYVPGIAVSGTTGRFDYAAEVKNASLSSPPAIWGLESMPDQSPTFSGRLGWRPDQSWNFGFSASSGSYLASSARSSVMPGSTLDDYREVLFGQDASFALHHWQLWAEVFETRFEIPQVGSAQTAAYYVEARFKATPQLALAARWNQQIYSNIPDGLGGTMRWGADIWRVDLGPAYRFTPHLQLKLQYSFQRQDAVIGATNHILALQLTARF